jgi:hypothetical protein
MLAVVHKNLFLIVAKIIELTNSKSLVGWNLVPPRPFDTKKGKEILTKQLLALIGARPQNGQKSPLIGSLTFLTRKTNWDEGHPAVWMRASDKQLSGFKRNLSLYTVR